MTFWSGAVAELHGAGATVDPSLEALEQRDFVRGAEESSLADEREWSFKHALIRDVAYARVPKGRRAHLHVRFADWMQGIPGAAEELVEILAYHLEQACQHAGVGRSDAPPPIERAVEALMSAAEKAERREGIREADRYYARALELLGDEQSEQALEAAARPGGHAEQARRARAGGRAVRRGRRGGAGARRAGPARAGADRQGEHRDQAGPRGRRPRSTSPRPSRSRASVGDPALAVRALFESASVRSWFDGDLDDGASRAPPRRSRSPRSSTTRRSRSRRTCGWSRCSTTSATSRRRGAAARGARRCSRSSAASATRRR